MNELDSITEYLCAAMPHYSITPYTWGYDLTSHYLNAGFNIHPAEGILVTRRGRYKIGKKRMERVVEAIGQEQAKRQQEVKNV